MLERMQKQLEEVKQSKGFLVRLGQNGLQFFGDDSSTDSQADTSQTDQQGSNQDDQSKDTQNQSDDTQQKSKGKTFTQEDVNNLVARETKKAQEKLFKQLGVKD